MEVRTSVRRLVEFILRSGDIDNRKAIAPEDAMQQGSRIHRMIQRKMGSGYRAEIPLSIRVPIDDRIHLTIDGRADGIIGNPEDGDDSIVIDEIKGTYRELEFMKKPVDVHLAQAKCYACIYAREFSLDDIGVRMTYCNIDTEEVRYFNFHYSAEELNTWFDALIEQYRKWAKLEVDWKQRRQLSIKELQFPFEYRAGQKELVGHVYRTIYHKKKLFLEAPTGVGKTISTAFPAVKAIGEGLADRIFYLTAKTITRTVAQEAFSEMRKQGLVFKSIVLTAKEKICFQGETECDPEHCCFAKGHYDRVNDAIYDLVTNETELSRELVERYAVKHQVCPFELCLDCSLFADAVICDYNYLFDPHAYLRRFFGEMVQGDYIFLIDEAHNLVDRGRDMYSAVLCKEDLLELKRKVKEHSPSISTALERANRLMLSMKKECDGYVILERIDALLIALNTLSVKINEFLERKEDSPLRKEILEFYFILSHFLMIAEKLDDKYVIYSEMASNGNFYVHLYCVDPSVNLRECMSRGRSSILFSATLLPIQYYKKLLGGLPEDYEVYANSVFDPCKRGLYIASDVTTKYTERGMQMYQRIAQGIKNIISRRQGNYLIFFPSHQFMKAVYESYEAIYYEPESEECILQEEFMTERDREIFLERFERKEKREPLEENDIFDQILMEIEVDDDPPKTEPEAETLLGFCVMGGIFSEGIDLKNDSLIGAIVVGTGLPQVCREREIMKYYFDEIDGNGFDYAYRIPGMNKVQQAAGRVIRTVDDVGIVALLDNRFLQNSSMRMFPREWGNYRVCRTEEMGKHIGNFWEEFRK